MEGVCVSFFKKHYFFIDSLGTSHHKHKFCSLPSPSISSLHPQKKNFKIKPKQNIHRNNNPPQKKKPSSLLHVSCLSDTFSFTLVASGPLCQRIYPFVQLALLAHVHCNESIIGLLQGLWFLAGVSFFKGSQLESARESQAEQSPQVRFPYKRTNSRYRKHQIGCLQQTRMGSCIS